MILYSLFTVWDEDIGYYYILDTIIYDFGQTFSSYIWLWDFVRYCLGAWHKNINKIVQYKKTNLPDAIL